MIEVTGLVKRYGAVEVLRGVDLDVGPGEVAALIGASGSGKSTFLRCVNGLEAFDRGEIRAAGLTFDAATPTAQRRRLVRQVCRRVGMVFQSFNLFPHRTVLQNVTEGPIYVLEMDRDAAETRALQLLDRVGLADRRDALPRELSGGQQQRVAIARALAMKPDAILFDEPTSALDPHMAAEVLSVMSDLARDGLTMIVVTHAMRFARHVAHSVHVFGDGRIVERGRPEQVFEDPRHDATKRLLLETRAA